MSNKPDSDLRELLAQLHERLGRANALDAESRAQLRAVSSDIEKTLARSASDTGVHESRLRELAVRFESEHPALAEAVRDVVDALGKAGV